MAIRVHPALYGRTEREDRFIQDVLSEKGGFLHDKLMWMNSVLLANEEATSSLRTRLQVCEVRCAAQSQIIKECGRS